MSPAPDDSVEAIAPGQILADRYVVAGVLGRGATGVVLAAHDRQASSPVAIKVLHRDVANDPVGRRRFARETRINAEIDHPHVVRVLDDGSVDGLPYIVMEHLGGGTLAAWLERTGRPPLDVALALAAQILSGVAAAHTRGLVHRDLKPSNVLLVDDRAAQLIVKVSDFGVAKNLSLLEQTDETTTLTVRGELCGTPAYMAPEQAQGEELDGRADLYSVGVLLFQLTTGTLPFTGKTAIAIVSRHLSEPPPRPSSVVGDGVLPPALEALILRSLAKDRGERPSSADVFLAEVNQIVRDLPAWRRRPRSATAMTEGDATLVPGVSDVATQRPPRRLRRMGLVAGLVVASGGAVAALLNGRSSDGPAPPVATPSPTRAAPVAVAPLRPAAPPIVPAPSAAPNVRPNRANRKVQQEPLAPPPTPLPAPIPASTIVDDPRRRVAALIKQGETLLGDGRRRDACELGEQAKLITPHAADVFRFLGKCYMRFGMHNEGRTHYRRYLELAPNAPDARFVRAMLGP